jgi:hypothetical protein
MRPDAKLEGVNQIWCISGVKLPRGTEYGQALLAFSTGARNTNVDMIE